ncbi:Outer membrane TonB-dependent transducer VreA of trans-envelope signaling system [plant metagenome]|uniref:Outer membrane TonB-dependent transducer VreA of trans-envelope signaling system n=1 Tax=plant metagenome TaxID=1297885 RepID=A0A484TGP9_9ZZZZ
MPPGMHRYVLPRLRLHDALQQYSEITGRSVLYDARQVAGLYSAPVHGVLDPDEALRKLISLSGLSPHFSGADAFMLKARPQGSGELSPLVAQAFHAQVQSRVTQALCDEPALQDRTYHLTLLFTVGPDRRIEGLRVHAQGRPALEAPVHARLDGLPIGMTAPTDLPQPLTLQLSGRDARVRQECAP